MTYRALVRGSWGRVSVALRWLVAVGASILAFFAVAVPWAVISDGGDDPWEVIGPVAGVVAAGVLAAGSWWASQAGRPRAGGTSERRVNQVARGQGSIRQTGGHHGAVSPARRGPVRERIRQKARGGGDIDQVGGDRA